MRCWNCYFSSLIYSPGQIIACHWLIQRNKTADPARKAKKKVHHLLYRGRCRDSVAKNSRGRCAYEDTIQHWLMIKEAKLEKSEYKRLLNLVKLEYNNTTARIFLNVKMLMNFFQVQKEDKVAFLLVTSSVRQGVGDLGVYNKPSEVK